MQGGVPTGEEAVLDALARIDRLRSQGLDSGRIAEVMAATGSPVPAGGTWTAGKVDRILAVFDTVRSEAATDERPAEAPVPAVVAVDPASMVTLPADGGDRRRSRAGTVARVALVVLGTAGVGAGGFLAINAVTGSERGETQRIGEATPATTTTALVAPVPTTEAPDPADTMVIRIETDEPAGSTSAPADAGDPVPATATIRSDGKLYIEGAFATAIEADAFVAEAGSVFGRDNVVASYVVDPEAPAPKVADVALDKPVLFESGTAEIDPEYIPFLEACAGVLDLNPHIVMSVTAYTDSAGPEELNLALSQRRAQAIIDFYREREIAEDQLVAIGVGEADPVAPNDTEEGRSRNRRAMLQLLNVVSDQADDAG